MTYPDRYNTLVVVVTYNPDIDFVSHFNRYVEIAEKSLIVDNNSEFNIKELVCEPLHSYFEFILSKENKGIAWGLNQGILYALENGYSYILTLDQDSLPLKNILEIYGEFLKDKEGIGLIGTSFLEKIDKDTVNNNVFKSKLSVITSGTLHCVEIFSQVGLYNEKLFIDSVDFEFSLRVKKAGYKVLRSTMPLLEHHLGSPISHYGIKSSNHNAIRRYYMTRNHIYVTKKFFKSFPWWIIKKNVHFAYSILIFLIVEKQKKEKIKEILRGVNDGFALQ